MGKCAPALLLAVFMSTACTQPCDAPEVNKINALYFTLKTGDGGFSQEQLDSAFVLRFQLFGDSLIGDTMDFTGYEGMKEKLVISRESPWRGDNSQPFYTQYDYLLSDPDSSFGVLISDIDIEGTYFTEKDCDYRNIKKVFEVDSQEVDMSGTQDYYTIGP